MLENVAGETDRQVRRPTETPSAAHAAHLTGVGLRRIMEPVAKLFESASPVQKTKSPRSAGDGARPPRWSGSCRQRRGERELSAASCRQTDRCGFGALRRSVVSVERRGCQSCREDEKKLVFQKRSLFI
eukprot:scaffold47_cov258-Pinguiococcus_pyrenoidosus.AAC.41